MLCLKVLKFMCSKGLHEIFTIEQRMMIVQKLWRYGNDVESPDVLLTDAEEENRRLRSTIHLLAQFLSLRGQEDSKHFADDGYCTETEQGDCRKSSSLSPTPSPPDSPLLFTGLLDEILLGLNSTDQDSGTELSSPDIPVPRDSRPPASMSTDASLTTSKTEERSRNDSPANLSPSPSKDFSGVPLHVPNLGANDVEEILLDASFVSDKFAATCLDAFVPMPFSAVESRSPNQVRPRHPALRTQNDAEEATTQDDLSQAVGLQTEDDSGKHEEKEERKEAQPITLWEFLLECLTFDCYEHIIRWRNKKEGTFKIVESQTLAGMWGMVKRKPGMNFDKMSRAMRYYYSKGILQKSSSASRLEYTFGERTTWRTFKPGKDAVPGRFFFLPHLPNSACAVNYLPGPLKAYQRLIRCSKSFKGARFIPYMIPSYAEVA